MFTQFFIPDITYGAENCGEMMEKLCLSKDIRVTKLVRATMEEISYFLDEIKDCNNNIKVIHLLRDPRGRINSITENGKIRRSFSIEQISALCKRQIQDINIRHKLQGLYPNIFMELLYEDISLSPLSMANKLYNFAFSSNISLPVSNWIIEHTQSKGIHEHNILKKNSTATSLAWQTQINPDLLYNIQVQCKDLISYLNFKMV